MKQGTLVGLLVLTILSGSLFSCHYGAGYETVNAGNKFTLTVPSWMKKVDDLKPGAEFQYANRYRNLYAIGTADEKNKAQKTKADLMTENLGILRKSLKDPVVTDSTDITVAGMKGIRVEIYGKMSNENIYFSEEVIEGPACMYHLSVWTRAEDRKLRFKGTINDILNSFKPI